MIPFKRLDRFVKMDYWAEKGEDVGGKAGNILQSAVVSIADGEKLLAIF